MSNTKEGFITNNEEIKVGGNAVKPSRGVAECQTATKLNKIVSKELKEESRAWIEIIIEAYLKRKTHQKGAV